MTFQNMFPSYLFFLLKALFSERTTIFFTFFFRTTGGVQRRCSCSRQPKIYQTTRQSSARFNRNVFLGGKGKLNFSFPKGSPAGRCCNPVTNASPCLDQARDAVSVVRARLAPGAALRLPATAAEEWRPPLCRRESSAARASKGAYGRGAAP